MPEGAALTSSWLLITKRISICFQLHILRSSQVVLHCCSKEANIKQNIQLLIFHGSNEPSAHLFFEVLPDCQEEISFYSLSFPYVKTMLSVLYNIMYNSLVYIFIFYSKLSYFPLLEKQE